MDKSTAVTFDYSKAAGLLSKAFINNRTHLLFEQESLSSLWSLLFKENVPLVPEVMLAEKIEQKAFDTFLSQYTYFLNKFDNPPLVLVDFLKCYEIENLKVIIDSLCSGETKLPLLLDLKSFSKIKVENWPDLQKMTKGTCYEWLKEIPSIENQQKTEFALDMFLFQENWKAVNSCKGENQAAHKELFLDEYIIKNILWALRLKIYYEMPNEQIIENLFYIDAPKKSDLVAGPAIKVLDFEIDRYSDWKDWKYAKYLNPQENGYSWRVDPTWIERRYMAHQAKFANHVFHSNPMEDVALAAWFKIKNYELTCIRTAVESIRLSVDSQEAMEAVGVNG